MLHVQGAGKREVTGANLLVAIFAEPESNAAFILQAHGVTRRDVTLYISHGIGKGQGSRPRRFGAGGEAPQGGRSGRDPDADGGDVADDPLEAYAVDLKAKAEAGRMMAFLVRRLIP